MSRYERGLGIQMKTYHFSSITFPEFVFYQFETSGSFKNLEIQKFFMCQITMFFLN